MRTLLAKLHPNLYDKLGLIAMTLLALMFVVPLASVLIYSLFSEEGNNFVNALGDAVFMRSLLATLQMAAWVTFFSILFGTPYAYVMARSGKFTLYALLAILMLSFWTSTLVRTYAWQILLNNTGIINRFLIDIGLIETAIPLIRTDIAVYIGMTQILMPFAILPIYAQMMSMPRDVELASRAMGARRITTFFTVTLPLTLPGIAAGGVLVFVTALGFYITPRILGDSSKLYVGSVIVQQLQVFLDIGVASAMAVILLAIVLVVLLVTAKAVGLDRILGLTRAKKAKVKQ